MYPTKASAVTRKSKLKSLRSASDENVGGPMKIYCKSCFATVWARYTEIVIENRVWRTCNDCGYSLCMGNAS